MGIYTFFPPTAVFPLSNGIQMQDGVKQIRHDATLVLNRDHFAPLGCVGRVNGGKQGLLYHVGADKSHEDGTAMVAGGGGGSAKSVGQRFGAQPVLS